MWPQRTFPQSSLQTQPGAQREGEGALQEGEDALPLKNSWRPEAGWVLGRVWGPRTVTQGCQAFGHMQMETSPLLGEMSYISGSTKVRWRSHRGKQSTPASGHIIPGAHC